MPCQIKVEHTSLTQLAKDRKWGALWFIPSIIAIMLGIDRKDKRWISPYSGQDVSWMQDNVLVLTFHSFIYTLKGWVVDRASFDAVWAQIYIGDELEREVSTSTSSSVYFLDDPERDDATSSCSTDTFGSCGEPWHDEDVWEELWGIRQRSL